MITIYSIESGANNGIIGLYSTKPKKVETLYNLNIEFTGEVAEWSNAPVLKTDVPKGTQGSNPCLSANF